MPRPGGRDAVFVIHLVHPPHATTTTTYENGERLRRRLVKQPNKPVYRALGNPTRGQGHYIKVTVDDNLAARSIGNQDLRVLSKALAMDQESLSGGFMGKDQEN